MEFADKAYALPRWRRKKVKDDQYIDAMNKRR